MDEQAVYSAFYGLTDALPVCSSMDINSYKNTNETANGVTAHHLVCSDHASSPQSITLAVSLTNNAINIYKLGCGLKKTLTLKGHKSTITGTKFSDTDSNVLYSCSMDGTVRIWDLRQSREARKLFHDSSDARKKPFSSFDVNCDETYACCGTDLVKQDAFLLFWDLRASKMLGGYWESHTDEITTVRFSPSNKNSVASGSIDGLINIFDITQPTEDDALLNTLNTESSVDVLAWCPTKSRLASDQPLNIACLTHVETLQLWDAEQVSPFSTVTREEIGSTFQLTSAPAFVSLEVSGHLNGTTLGVVSCSNEGDVFLAKIEANKPVAHSVLSGGHKKSLSAAFWDTKDLAVTCDEDGNLCLWQLETTGSACEPTTALSKSKKNDIVGPTKTMSISCPDRRWKPY